MNTTEQFSRITDDIAYLVDEAEALTLVIDVVPATEKSSGITSILDMIYLIDHAQLTYFRPLVEQLFSLPKVQASLPDFRTTADFSSIQHESTEAVLKNLIRNRKSFVAYLQAAGQDCIEKAGEINGQTRTIADVLQEMIVFERQQLKLVAERVLAIDRSNQNKGKPQQ
ncbi:hypothetical protein CYPRO_2243 [Cyclonatronum proteinivorum]|uniref:Uncharacterized protein n=1 Tax=Cyclonatronum proteinivorum TaxID=1457365 RepID=A0A345ULY8_9BACT|nr:hypothetical protein [Cyclonatronum proteinivorum]AXJ01490.1 hypothetical protein CYPRO_2243 [Cyclonatronum proteinivorum]